MNILVSIPIGEIADTFITKRVKASLERLGDVTYNTYKRQYTKEELKDLLKGVDIVICGWGTPKFNSETIKSADKLKIIAYTGGSLTGVVTDSVYEKDIIVLGGNCVFAESVAESCICYTMCALRRIEKYVSNVRNGGWHEGGWYNEGIMDRTVGLVGFGMIAKYFAEMLQPFRVNLKIFSGYLSQEEADKYNAKVVSLDEIFETCDVISIHSALTPKNINLVGAEQLKKMKNGALIVNTARGAIINEDALIAELKTGRIHAALDVYSKEPLDTDSPLRTLPNVLPVPHMGGPTIDRREYVTLTLINDIEKILKGDTKDIQTFIASEYIKNMSI